MKNAGFPAILKAFFTERLMAQRRVSPHTIASYRDTFRLLLQFCQKRLRKPPSQLTLADLNAPLLGKFLDDLEADRANGARSRNLRLTAIRSFFRYAALEAPDHSGLIQRVLAIPNKRQPRPLVDFLTRPEFEAVLAVPNRNNLAGASRPCSSFDSSADRLAAFRDHRSSTERGFAPFRRPYPVYRKRTEGTVYAFGEVHSGRARRLDKGTRKGRCQDSVPKRTRRLAQFRFRSVPGRQIR
jgi:hypothetical protein